MRKNNPKVGQEDLSFLNYKSRWKPKAEPKFQFLTVSVDENAVILVQPDTFERKYIEFLY